ncbi:MAG: DUF4372 domain-containing protein [Polaromonas sp.]|nr:DUF4372 domain-containing protein [Polaromonas sp.]
MRQGNLVFAQLTTYLSLRSFRRCVATIGANKRSRTFSFLVQFIAMAFTHLTYRESFVRHSGQLARTGQASVQHELSLLDNFTQNPRPTTTRTTFLTNNLDLKPELIVDLYLQRWQVEVFYKWIKQHLRIKVFLGTSENAVKMKIWIAVRTYVLIAIHKKHLHLPHSFYEVLKILNLTMFQTSSINQLLTPSLNNFHQQIPD